MRVRSRDWDTLPVPLEGCVVLSLYDCLVTHQTKGLPHVRQPNLQGSDRRVRLDRRDRVSWYLLLGRDGRVALCAVRPCFALLCDVHSRFVLVDGVWAGTRPVGALRAQRVGRTAPYDSLSIIDTN